MEFLTFSGRAGRLEYLGFAVLGGFIHLINALVFIDTDPAAGGALFTSPLYLLGFVLATVITWSSAVRRCHDIGRSGFFLLWQFVPILGIAAALFVLLVTGDDMKNRYGPPPWSVTNRAEKRAELERASLAVAIEQQVKPDQEWVTDDGAFDMDGLWNDSGISR